MSFPTLPLLARRQNGNLMDIETWKPIHGYEGRYEVSDLGRVRSLARIVRYFRRNGSARYKPMPGLVMKPYIDRKGHYHIMLSKDGKTKRWTLSRDVAFAFVENPKSLPQVDHLNGNPADDKASNLEWVTNLANHRRSHVLELPKTKLSYSIAREVRRSYVDLVSSLSQRYGVQRDSILAILKHETWKEYSLSDLKSDAA